MNRILHKLAIKHKTDKYNAPHTFNGMNYLDIYEKYFASLKNKPLKILEIGVRTGSSLRMWKEYFPNAQIFGLDVRPDCIEHEEDRISITIGDQADPKVLDETLKKAGGQFDIIIDDGSHVNVFTLKSFHYLFPHLTPNGIYVIEDMRPTYCALEDMNIRARWYGGPWMDKSVNINNDRQDLMNFFKEKLEDLDFSRGDIMSIQFWSQLCFIIKC